MTIYAYLRVSTNQQDVDNQRHGILEYANQKSLGHLKFISDSVSGQKRWRDRELGKLLTKTTQSKDVLIFAEISRMARSTLLEAVKDWLARDGKIPTCPHCGTEIVALMATCVNPYCRDEKYESK